MKKKSFSLLEVLFAVVIFIFAATLTIATSSNAINTRYKTKNIAQVQKNAQNISQYLTNLAMEVNSCGYYTNPVGGATYYWYGMSMNPYWTDDDGDQTYQVLAHNDADPVTRNAGGAKKGSHILGIYIDQFNDEIKKIVYFAQTEGNIYAIETLNNTLTHKRKLNDSDVKITNLTFYTSNLEDTEEYCETNEGKKLPFQNFLMFEMDITSKYPDPKGNYTLHFSKYVSTKNYNYKTRYQ